MVEKDVIKVTIASNHDITVATLLIFPSHKKYQFSNRDSKQMLQLCMLKYHINNAISNSTYANIKKLTTLKSLHMIFFLALFEILWDRLKTINY